MELKTRTLQLVPRGGLAPSPASLRDRPAPWGPRPAAQTR
jgi:hypothetical protein